MKKTVSTLTALALTASVLAACGSGDSDGGASASASPSGAPAASEGPKPELRQLGFARNFDVNADPVAKLLEEKTGYKVKYEALPLENTDDKLNLLMANKEPIDILKLSGSQYNRLAAQGALEPLDDLLQKYGKTLLAVNEPETFENAKVDGKIYGIPEKHPRGFVGSSLAIRQELLDELGLQVPTTIDEFYNLLKAIKEKKGIIPFSGFESMVHEISGAFGVVTSFEESNGKLIHRLEDPGMKEYLAFMNKLYKEGLLDPEWPVNKAATVQQKFTTGKVGVITYGWGSAPATQAALEKNMPGSKITLIHSLKGKDGQRANWKQGGGVSWYIAIPKSSKNKEEAMKYLDLKVQPELFKDMSIGQEGVTYKVENGKMVPILPAFNELRGNSDWYMTSSDVKAYAEYWLLRLRKDPVMNKVFEEIQANEPNVVSDPTLLAPPLAVVGNNLQKLNKLESDYIIKVFAGAEDLSGYDQFVAQWKSQGGSDVLAAYNEWYAKSKK
ncbi:extracellular solute-binding protein [Paenibacillus thermoaerophilus]|jgi:putative aldouronate transport system substrate-binding protein|uniref:Extracellular solute-binding protein n=1 Tax=Paenibacillus thermoaerophilus TaxID=1215385 RepID=A0ABW2V1Y4_9BACL|nr:extracellular solute-binding protein [Paenibacillus thermoaerophilus]TMV17786.1 extracellular solute-binding protein [Paenibacillus thermoaerophilus]